MSTTVVLAFVAACVLLALTPGPNMGLIIANTLSGGLRAGLVTLLGSGTGLAILVAVAALGMTSVMVFMSEWFDVVRWVGALYLVVLGVRQMLGWWRSRGAPAVEARVVSGRSRYLTALAVSLSNPKVLLFLGAFLPQFVDPNGDVALQLTVLAVLFVTIIVGVDMIYTIALARARARIPMEKLRLLDGLAGGLLVLGGLVLATARRP
jgi:threonine/homoserine/homoserine lactone efflux protein